MKRKYAKRDLYKEITQRFVAALKNGAPPWLKPWSIDASNAGRPSNAVTGRPYNGINVAILWNAAAVGGFISDRWLTYRQAADAGGQVRRGQKGTVAILYREHDAPRTDDSGARVLGENGQPVIDTIKLIRGFTLFNVEQCAGLPIAKTQGPCCPQAPPKWNSHQAADALLARHNVKIGTAGNA